MYIRRILVGILIVGILVGCYFMYNITQTIFKPITNFNNEAAYINIPSDGDFQYVRNEIEPLVNDIESFEMLAKKIGYIDRVKGGKYVILKGMNSNDILNTLLANSTWVNVVIPDNKTPQELATIIANQIEAEEEKLFSIISDSVLAEESFLRTTLKPGTYSMPWNTSAEDFLSRMLSIVEKSNGN